MVISATEHDFLASMITDETLDEAFPPTAQDAAELEAVEFFVALMANLDELEEQDYAIRSLRMGMKKRWEVRRGLVGKPRAAMNRIKHVDHVEPRLVDIHDVVVLDKSPTHLEHQMLVAKSRRPNGGKPRQDAKVGLSRHQRNMPIQQPRKNS